jgi:hypothetical protein
MQSYQYPKLELKYCERCGGLWLRPQGGDAVYCAPCERDIAELPPIRSHGGNSSGTLQAVYSCLAAASTALLNLSDCVGAVCQ